MGIETRGVVRASARAMRFVLALGALLVAQGVLAGPPVVNTTNVVNMNFAPVRSFAVNLRGLGALSGSAPIQITSVSPFVLVNGQQNPALPITRLVFGETGVVCLRITSRGFEPDSGTT